MAEIIEFNPKVEEESETFAIREEGGDLKPIEDWSGEDWEALVEGPFAQMAEHMGTSKWEVLAQFMSGILNDTLPNADE